MLPSLADVPTIVSTNAEFEQFLPWGPFFRIFAPADTPAEAIAELTDAYTQAVGQDDFVAFMEGRGFTMMNISGDEAQDFLTNWQRNTAWLLQDAGLTQSSPEEFGIERP